MLAKLFLAFTLIPLAELWLLIEVGSRIGAWSTIGLVLLTGFAGAWLARLQGLMVLNRVRQSMAQGVMPTEELQDGLCILVAGVMLLTPGLLTDLAGLSLLFPPTRQVLKRWLKNKMRRMMDNGTIVIHRGGGFE